MEISLREYVQRVDELIEKGRYDEAQAHLRHILQHYPKYLSAYRLFGQVLLEMGQDGPAEEMFRRALSGDPEDFIARVGMSMIYDRHGDLLQALWQMERAFELAPENEVIQEELRQLYGRRDGLAPARVRLTRGALGRLYLRGGMYARAAEVFRSLIAEDTGANGPVGRPGGSTLAGWTASPGRRGLSAGSGRTPLLPEGEPHPWRNLDPERSGRGDDSSPTGWRRWIQRTIRRSPSWASFPRYASRSLNSVPGGGSS